MIKKVVAESELLQDEDLASVPALLARNANQAYRDGQNRKSNHQIEINN